MGARMTVSKETQSFIECLSKLDENFGMFLDALESAYDTKQATSIINMEFDEQFRKLRAVVERHVILSINEKISLLENQNNEI